MRAEVNAERPEVFLEFDDAFLEVKKNDIDGEKNKKHVQTHPLRLGKLKKKIPGLGKHQADGLRKAAREPVGLCDDDPSAGTDFRHAEILIPNDARDARPERGAGGRTSA